MTNAERHLECLRLAVELAKANGSVWNPQATVLAAGQFCDFVEGRDCRLSTVRRAREQIEHYRRLGEFVRRPTPRRAS